MTAFERWAIWISSLLVTATGLVYAWMKYLLPEPAGFSVVRHPLQPLVLKLHIVTAPLLLLALGSVALRHIWRHMDSGTEQGRASGWSAALTTIPMILTGYFLQVFVAEGVLRSLSIAHIVTGIIYGGGLLVHQVVIRRVRT